MSFGNDIQFSAGLDASQYRAELRNMMSQTRALAKNLNSASNQMSAPFSGIQHSAFKATSTIIGLTASYIALKKTFKGLLGPGVQVNAMLETNMLAFDKIAGKVIVLKDYMRELVDFAIKTPYTLQGIVDGTKKLMAYGIEAKNALPVMRMLGDASAGIGLSSEGLDRMILAVGQINSKGKLLGQEAKQLAEVGLNVYAAVAYNLKISTAQAMKMGEDGLISSALALQSLDKYVAEKFGGMMEAQQKTFTGAIANFKDSLSILQATIIKDGFNDFTKVIVRINELTESFFKSYNYWIDNGMSSTQALVYSIQNLFNTNGSLDWLITVIDRVSSSYGIFKDSINEGIARGNIFDGIVTGIKRVVKELFGANSNITFLIEGYMIFLKNIKDVFVSIVGVFNSMSPELQKILISLSLMVYLSGRVAPALLPFVNLLTVSVLPKMQMMLDLSKRIGASVSTFMFGTSLTKGQVLFNNGIDSKIVDITKKYNLEMKKGTIAIDKKRLAIKKTSEEIKKSMVHSFRFDNTDKVIAKERHINNLISRRKILEKELSLMVRARYDKEFAHVNNINRLQSKKNIPNPGVLGSIKNSKTGAPLIAVPAALKGSMAFIGKIAISAAALVIALGAIVIAVGLIVTWFQKMKKETEFVNKMAKQADQIKKAWTGFITGVKKEWNKFYKENEKSFTEINNMLSDLFSNNGNLIQNILDGILLGFKGILVVAKILLPIFKFLINSLINIRDYWTEITQDFKNNKTIGDFGGTIWRIISGETKRNVYSRNADRFYSDQDTAMAMTNSSLSTASIKPQSTQIVNVNLDAKNFKDVSTAVYTLQTLGNNLRMGTTY